MRNAKELAETEKKIQDYIAKGMPDLSHVECMKCGRRQKTTHAVDVGQFLAAGWPKCCSEAMQLFTARDEAARSNGGKP